MSCTVDVSALLMDIIFFLQMFDLFSREYKCGLEKVVLIFFKNTLQVLKYRCGILITPLAGSNKSRGLYLSM